MSLTSRITNLFSGSARPSEDSGSLGILDDGVSGAGNGLTGIKSGTASLGSTTIMAQEEDEEEARRPYLHVCYPGIVEEGSY